MKYDYCCLFDPVYLFIDALHIYCSCLEYFVEPHASYIIIYIIHIHICVYIYIILSICIIYNIAISWNCHIMVTMFVGSRSPMTLMNCQGVLLKTLWRRPFGCSGVVEGQRFQQELCLRPSSRRPETTLWVKMLQHYYHYYYHYHYDGYYYYT
jgi:hypothetical protein